MNDNQKKPSKTSSNTGSKIKTLKTEVIDWIKSLIFAVVVVFFVSLFLLQLFVIPSSSMYPTFNAAGDRVGVFKRAYGTEFFAFGPKTDSKSANRGDIIVFYNPFYKSKGVIKENLSNALFLLTLSLYNPSKEEKLFVKRAVGIPYDTIKITNGDVYIKKFSDSDFKKESEVAPYYKPFRDSEFNNRSGYFEYTKEYLSAKEAYEKIPYNTKAISEFHRFNNGTYIPKNHVFPMGDNRDNSADARFFGPVSMSKVIGRGVFKFWPITEFKVYE